MQHCLGETFSAILFGIVTTDCGMIPAQQYCPIYQQPEMLPLYNIVVTSGILF